MGLQLEVALPKSSLSETYFACRYACLREPLGFPVGAERLEDDTEAIHAWWETDEGEVVAVGRIH